jgi:uncharacterized BrkB/YihY/UPF0761 family membrane protein
MWSSRARFAVVREGYARARQRVDATSAARLQRRVVELDLMNQALVLPALVAWAWWGQHVLLAGRVTWRALLPGAVALALALAGLRLVLHFYLSRNIESQYPSYGPIGVVFVLQSWFIAFSVVMLGGPLLGRFISGASRADNSS